MTKIRNRKSKNLGSFDFEGLQSTRLTKKTFEIEMSWVFTVPVVCFVHIIDFRSYVDAAMSLYSII